MNEPRHDLAIPDVTDPGLRVTFHEDGSYTVHDTRPGPRKFVRMVTDAEWPPPAPGAGDALSAEQSGYVHLLERLLARVRAGEVRMLRYSAVAGMRDAETDFDSSILEREPTGEMTLTFWCQQLVVPAPASVDPGGRS